jgi:hypothetical protein
MLYMAPTHHINITIMHNMYIVLYYYLYIYTSARALQYYIYYIYYHNSVDGPRGDQPRTIIIIYYRAMCA